MVDRELLLNETTSPIVERVKAEFIELVDKIGADEEWEELGRYLFDVGYQRLSSEIGMNMEDLIQVIVRTYDNTLQIIADRARIDFRPRNVADDTQKMIRFINFIHFLKNYDKTQDFGEVAQPWQMLKNNYTSIKEFVFIERYYWRPSHFEWSRAFILMEKHTETPRNEIGFRPYYLKGMAFVIHSIRNKHQHPEGFEKQFVTDISDTFYNDFTNMVGVYNLSIMAYIELLEAWASVSDCFDKETGALSL